MHKFQLAIASGELRPLDRLPQHETIASQERVSHTAVTKAFRQLEQFGLIEFSKGYKVRAAIDQTVLYGLEMSLQLQHGRSSGVPKYSIDPSTTALQYQQIAVQITSAIASGFYAPGDRLPTAIAMSRAHAIGKTAFAKAYKLLQEQGVCTLIRGHGCFVRFIGGADSNKPEVEGAFQSGRVPLPLDIVVEDVKIPAKWQIFNQLATAILSGDLQPGMRLPNASVFSKQVGVSVTTAEGVYQQLVFGGAVERHSPRGYFVRDKPDVTVLRLAIDMRRISHVPRASPSEERRAKRLQILEKQQRFLKAFTLDRKRGISLLEQVQHEVRRAIARGTVVSGDILPSAVTLAAKVGVHNRTVRRAYDALTDSGVLACINRRWAVSPDLASIRREALELTIGDFQESVFEMIGLGMSASAIHELCDGVISQGQSRSAADTYSNPS
jgi:DNA-binding transcriptional regulator YhcF (GntR family)